MQVEIQLLGVIVHGLGTYGIFFEGGTGMSKKNLVCASILYGLHEWVEKYGELPSTLHVQLDNCSGDNKNHTVMGLCAHLVGCGVFSETNVSSWRAAVTRTVFVYMVPTTRTRISFVSLSFRIEPLS